MLKQPLDSILHFQRTGVIEYKEYETDEQSENIELNVVPLPLSTFCKLKVPDKIIESLNAYLDNALQDDDHPSHAPRLVGQIKRGKQLLMVKEHKLIIPFSNFLKQACDLYLRDHFANCDGKIETIVDEIWSVHQYESDYNPLHHHTTKLSEHGLSSFIHIKLPEQLSQERKNKIFDFDASGRSDGTTNLIWGSDHACGDGRNMKFPQKYQIPGETGMLYIFPQWLEHMVYPFFGEGERRTVAANTAIKFH